MENISFISIGRLREEEEGGASGWELTLRLARPPCSRVFRSGAIFYWQRCLASVSFLVVPVNGGGSVGYQLPWRLVNAENQLLSLPIHLHITLHLFPRCVSSVCESTLVNTNVKFDQKSGKLKFFPVDDSTTKHLPCASSEVKQLR